MGKKYFWKKTRQGTDFDFEAMHDHDRNRKIKKKSVAVGALLLVAGVVLADYALPDGTIVQYVGGASGSEIRVQRPNGTIENVTGVLNSNGRLTPPDLTNSQYTQTLPSQTMGSGNPDGQTMERTVPIFTNGQFTGYGNVWSDSSPYGNEYTYTNNTNGSGITGSGNSAWVRDTNPNAGSIDMTNGGWRVDITNPTSSSGGGGGGAGGWPGTGFPGDPPGTYTPPPPPPPPPPRYAIDSFSLFHNDAWEEARERNERSVSQFYAGEPVEVKVIGENISSARVTFELGNPNQDMPVMLLDSNDRRPTFKQAIPLSMQGGMKGTGEGWLKHWAMLPDGTYNVRLDVTYRNGSTATRIEQIQILGSVMDKLKPGGSTY